MNNIFMKYLDKRVLYFLNDILIYSKCEMSMGTIYEWFCKCGENTSCMNKLENVTSTISRYSIWVTILIYLSSVEAIMNWLTPRNVVDMISSMGLSKGL